MRCPFCQALDTKVIDSRLHAEGSQIRRRRVCPDCDQRFSTYESAELVMPDRGPQWILQQHRPPKIHLAEVHANIARD